MACLELQNHSTRSAIPLSTQEFLIGRRTSQHLSLSTREVSGRHARIVSYQNDYYLEDLDSKNGTYINGQRIRTARLRDGDRIQIGQHRVFFRNPAHKKSPKVPVIARLTFTHGPMQHRVFALEQILTSLGDPERLVLLFSRQADGYHLLLLRRDPHISPQINGQTMSAEQIRLMHGDQIHLGPHQMHFHLPN